MDLYLEQRNQKAASIDKVDIDGRLAAIVERMFERYGHCSFVMPTLPEALPFLHNFKWVQLCCVWGSHGYGASCRCFADGQFEQAVGIALEARRLDKLEQTIKSSPDMVKTLTYSLQVCQTLVVSREFRQQVSLTLEFSCHSRAVAVQWSKCAQTYTSSSKRTLCRCCGFSSNCMRVSQTLIGLTSANA